MSLHIEGRRWFQRTYGNTYNTVRIFKDGQQVAFLPQEYGYGDHFLQRAVDWLRRNGYPSAEYGTQYLREVLCGTYSVIDVQRQKDL